MGIHWEDDTTKIHTLDEVVSRVKHHNAVGTDVNLNTLQAWQTERDDIRRLALDLLVIASGMDAAVDDFSFLNDDCFFCKRIKGHAPDCLSERLSAIMLNINERLHNERSAPSV